MYIARLVYKFHSQFITPSFCNQDSKYKNRFFGTFLKLKNGRLTDVAEQTVVSRCVQGMLNKTELAGVRTQKNS